MTLPLPLKYLRDAQIDSGEILHSFRSGCALTLDFSGSPLADVMAHVGWSTSTTALNYLKLADLLASALPQCQEASRVYEDYNALKDFLPRLCLRLSVHFHLSLSASSMCVYANFTTLTTYLLR